MLQEFGLPYGYLNIFSHGNLTKDHSKPTYLKTMIHYTFYNADEVERNVILMLCKFQKKLLMFQN